jgi:nitrogen fixation NifU-like protein
MAELSDLYQELILDHNKSPRNRGRLDHPNGEADGYNPLCGDKIHVTVLVKDGVIADVRFEGSGCAISTASASLMTEAVKGRTIDEAQALFEKFHHVVMGEPVAGVGPDLGKLEALAGVQRFPVRVKCATLAWHTLRSALEGEGGTVSTE